MAAFGEWARGVAQRSLDTPGDDIISEAAENLRELGIMDRPEERRWLDGYALNVVMAGHETTVNTVAGGIVSLLRDRDQWQALVDDPSLIPERGAGDPAPRYGRPDLAPADRQRHRALRRHDPRGLARLRRDQLRQPGRGRLRGRVRHPPPERRGTSRSARAPTRAWATTSRSSRSA